MRRFALLGLVAGIVLAGCGSSSDASTEAPPKGPPPQTVQAPPGAMNPEQRAAAAQSGAKSDQDPGGDNGK